MRLRKLIITALAMTVCTFGSARAAEERKITVASTTSTEQSGLFGHILPIFENASGLKVRVVALGSGQALDTARRGDADLAFVHDPVAEEKFVADGFGVARHEVMYNDFVLIGPRQDPAKVAGKDILEGLRRIAAMDMAGRPAFVSRGDKSGTHAAELRYWKAAGVALEKIKGPWYRDTGSGMGPSLNMASSVNAYILADRGTWLSFKNRGDLAILVEGDARLFNPYGVILVNPARHPHIRKENAQQFIDWLVSAPGQKAIADYKIDGNQLFFPNARR